MVTVSTSDSKKSYHHGDLRAALLAAALDLLEEGGPATLSLREAARRAGVSAMAPYRHFADRNALLAGVATIGFTRFRAALLAADRERHGREALIAQGVAYLAFACANPALFRLMFSAELVSPDRNLAQASRSAYAVLADRVASLVSPDKADDWTLMCWSVVHGLAMLSIDGKLDLRAEPATILAERLLHLLGSAL